MQFDQILDDPQPEAQASRGIRFALPERLEDVGQEVRMDPDPAITHDQHRGRVVTRDSYPDVPAGRCEFDGVRQEVDHNLAKASRIASNSVAGPR